MRKVPYEPVIIAELYDPISASEVLSIYAYLEQMIDPRDLITYHITLLKDSIDLFSFDRLRAHAPLCPSDISGDPRIVQLLVGEVSLLHQYNEVLLPRGDFPPPMFASLNEAMSYAKHHKRESGQLVW
jgi:hypothetical protein